MQAQLFFSVNPSFSFGETAFNSLVVLGYREFMHIAGTGTLLCHGAKLIGNTNGTISFIAWPTGGGTEGGAMDTAGAEHTGGGTSDATDGACLSIEGELELTNSKSSQRLAARLSQPRQTPSLPKLALTINYKTSSVQVLDMTTTASSMQPTPSCPLHPPTTGAPGGRGCTG